LNCRPKPGMLIRKQAQPRQMGNATRDAKLFPGFAKAFWGIAQVAQNHGSAADGLKGGRVGCPSQQSCSKHFVRQIGYIARSRLRRQQRRVMPAAAGDRDPQESVPRQVHNPRRGDRSNIGGEARHCPYLWPESDIAQERRPAARPLPAAPERLSQRERPSFLVGFRKTARPLLCPSSRGSACG